MTCEGDEAGAQRQKSSFIGNCPVMSVVQRVCHFIILADQNMCFNLWDAERENGVWRVNVAVKIKFLHFFGPAYLAVLDCKFTPHLSYKSDCCSLITVFSGKSCLLLSFPFLFV